MATAAISISIPPSPPVLSPSSSSVAMAPQRTNTLIVTSLPQLFFEPSVLAALYDHFVSYGPLRHWVPLRSFGRAILVYENDDDAERVKAQCDGLLIEATSQTPETTIRVFRSTPTALSRPVSPTTGQNPYHLRPPPLEKNFLISPPGSPPVGWEQVREDPPNATPLAEDLIVALSRLQMHGREGEVEVLVEPGEGVGVGVYVEYCGPAAEDAKMEPDDDQWVYGNVAPYRARWMHTKTARPPVTVA